VFGARLKNGQDTGPLSALTSREEQILDLIVKGLSNIAGDRQYPMAWGR